jgi:acyl-CoA thioesterase
VTAPALRARIAADPYATRLGIELLELSPGRARATLALGPELTNFHGQPHGGAIFSLADAAFAAACNAGAEERVALTVTIQFLAAVPAGTRLYADARATREGRRAGFYAITVTAEDGTLVASCQAVALPRPRPGSGTG